MNNIVVFDTHQVVKRFVEAGFTEIQAEIVANEQKAIIESNLATKRDVKEVEERITKVEERITRIEERITRIEQDIVEIRRDISDLRVLIYKTTIATIVAIVTILKVLPKIGL